MYTEFPATDDPSNVHFHIEYCVRLTDYPAETHPRKDGDEIIFGDMHGNALKLIYCLLKEQILYLIQDSYEKLKTIYRITEAKPKPLHRLKPDKYEPKPSGKLKSDDLRKFKRIINKKAKLTDKCITVRLLGDLLADRGNNDYFTLIIISKLVNSENITLFTNASNHDLEFIYFHEHQYRALFSDYKADDEDGGEIEQHFEFDIIDDSAEDKGEDKKSDSTKKFKSYTMSKFFTYSLHGLVKLIKDNLIEYAEIEQLIKDYKSTLILLGYSKTSYDGKDLLIYSHAPIGLTAIEYAAKKFNIKFKFENVDELAKTIDEINTSFKHDVDEGTIIISHYKISDKFENFEMLFSITAEKKPQKYSDGNTFFNRLKIMNFHGHISEKVKKFSSNEHYSFESDFGKTNRISDEPPNTFISAIINPINYLLLSQMMEKSHGYTSCSCSSHIPLSFFYYPFDDDSSFFATSPFFSVEEKKHSKEELLFHME